jgi:hypothetical protein
MGMPVLTPGPTTTGATPKLRLQASNEDAVELRHHRGDDRALDVTDGDVPSLDERQDQLAHLVAGRGAVGGDAEVVDQRGGAAGSGLVEAKHRVGVADIDHEKHARALAGCRTPQNDRVWLV